MRYAYCYWCKELVDDGSEQSGGPSPDWMIDGDFGCGDSPLTNEEGVGPHETEEQVLNNYRAGYAAVELLGNLPDDVKALMQKRLLAIKDEIEKAAPQ